MGDRACTIIKGSGAGTVGVCIYTHWHGEEMADLLRGGLLRAKAAGRMKDGNYCVRMVFMSMMEATHEGARNAFTESTGWGVSSADEDLEDEHSGPMVVDLDAQTIVSRGRRGAKPMPLEKFLAYQPLPRRED